MERKRLSYFGSILLWFISIQRVNSSDLTETIYDCWPCFCFETSLYCSGRQITIYPPNLGGVIKNYLTNIQLTGTGLTNLENVTSNVYPNLITFSEHDNPLIDCKDVLQWYYIIEQAEFTSQLCPLPIKTTTEKIIYETSDTNAETTGFDFSSVETRMTITAGYEHMTSDYMTDKTIFFTTEVPIENNKCSYFLSGIIGGFIVGLLLFVGFICIKCFNLNQAKNNQNNHRLSFESIDVWTRQQTNDLRLGDVLEMESVQHSTV